MRLSTRRGFCAFALGTLMARAALASQQVCVRHALGDICLDQPARRVIALENRNIENLLALDMQPVGATSTASYRTLMQSVAPALAVEVVDIGLPATPNIERMLALQPDLIVGNARAVQKNYQALRMIAPTMVFDAYPSGGVEQFGHMMDILRATAQAVGRSDADERFVREFEAQLRLGRERLAASGLQGRKVVLGNINAGITGADVMIFNDNALSAEILRRLGFEYGYSDARYREKTFNVSTVEALVEIQDFDFLYMPFNAQGVRNLMATPIWRNLRFVKEGRFHAIPYRLIHGGPLSARMFCADVLTAFLP